MAGITKVDNEMLQWDESKTGIISKLGQMVQYFQLGASESNGVPDYYLDPSVLTPILNEIDVPDDIPEDLLEAAKVPIMLEDGIPVIDGIPYWERLDGEPVPYYKLFKEYRDMKYLNEASRFSRSIARLAESTQMSGKQINALAKSYHWMSRAKAYDIFKQAEKAMLKQQAVESLESKHAAMSSELLEQAVGYLLQHPEQLSPKTAIDLAKLAIETGRLSVGLDPSKPNGGANSRTANKTDINIINQNAVSADGPITQGNISMSNVQKQAQENSQDVSNLQSILHVLNASGAFAEASGQSVDDGINRDAEGNKIDDDGNIITDVEFETE